MITDLKLRGSADTNLRAYRESRGVSKSAVALALGMPTYELERLELSGLAVPTFKREAILAEIDKIAARPRRAALNA